ncbi:MAG: CopG family transcriptional regulator [Acaryochloridaceae cyanobacterium CSU_3_4]|nr:CopG family transcriptional regulator [Leptolyngbyaceae cyanobacterium SU_3_3]NJN39558.1 CopG family transcriptional regulator [Acaryochloridaceae cyanobacterium CSU_3_4]
MKEKVTITLDTELIAFVDDRADGNRSDYFNSLVQHHRQAVLKQQMIQALQEEVENPDYQAEIDAWDSVVGDGLDAEG